MREVDDHDLPVQQKLRGAEKIQRDCSRQTKELKKNID